MGEVTVKKLIDWSVFGAVALAVWIAAGPSTLGGPASYVIVDGRSMEPTYVDSDLVVAYERAVYEPGDVIVYDAAGETQFNVIHRIIERTDGGFITQGDNRDEPDGWIAPDDAIYGKALFHIPRGGAIVAFVRQPAAILAFLAGWLTLAIFDRRRTSDEKDLTRGDETDCPDGEARDVSDHPNVFVATQFAPASSPEPQPKEKVREPVSKKTVAIFGIAALIGGSAGVMVANAASLRVDAGVLQAFSITNLPEPPAPPLEAVTVNLQVHFFSSGQGPDPGQELGEGVSPAIFDAIEVPVGHTYDLEWNGPGNSNVIDCFDDDRITFRGEPPAAKTSQGTQGPFGPLDETEAITHLVCIQTAPGNISDNLGFITIDAQGVPTTVELSSAPLVDEMSNDVGDGDSGADSGSSGDTTVSGGDNAAHGSDRDSTPEDHDGSDGDPAASDPNHGSHEAPDDDRNVGSGDPLSAGDTPMAGEGS